MKKNSTLILLYVAVALVSCQKKEIEKLSTNSITTGSSNIQSSDVLRYFFKAATNDNMFIGGSVDGITWTSGQIDNRGTMKGSPAATLFNGRIYQFHRGRTNNNIHYTYSANRGDSWTADVNLPNGAATTGEISACTFDGKMFLAYNSRNFNLGSNASNIFYSYSSDGVTWTEVVLPYANFVDPYIFKYGNKICIMYSNTIATFPTFTILSSSDGITWTQGPELNFGFVRFSVAANPIVISPSQPITATVVGTDRNGQLKTAWSNDLVNWSTPTNVRTVSGQLSYTSKRPSICIGDLGLVVMFKSQSNNNIIYATPDSYDIVERGNVSGATTESPYLIFTR